MLSGVTWDVIDGCNYERVLAVVNQPPDSASGWVKVHTIATRHTKRKSILHVDEPIK